MMTESDWTFIVHWLPSVGAILILTVFALILQALERRSRREGSSGAGRK
jgi:hypothetical protein